MPRTNDINQCMNNSNALIAPVRSEIRISISLPVINYRLLSKKVFNAVSCSSSTHAVSLLSAGLLSAISILELSVFGSLLIVLGVISGVSFVCSFFGIMNEFGGYRGIMDDIKSEETFSENKRNV